MRSVLHSTPIIVAPRTASVVIGLVLATTMCLPSLAWAADAPAPQPAPPTLPARDIGRSIFNHDGSLFVLNRRDSIEVRHVGNGDVAMRIVPAGLKVHAVAFSPDGATIAAGGTTEGGGGEARLWDAKTGKELHRTTDFKVGLYNVHFSPDGARLLVLDIADRSAHLIDVKTGAKTFSAACEVHYSTTDLDFSADGRWLCAPLFRQAVIWDAATGAERCRLLPFEAERTLRNHDEFAKIRLNGAGTMAAALAQDANGKMGINLYDAANGNLLRSLSIDTMMCDLAISPDGKFVAAALSDSRPDAFGRRDDAEIRVWDVGTGGMIRSLPVQGYPSQLWFSPDGSRVWTHGFKEIDGKRVEWGYYYNIETGEDLGSAGLLYPQFSRSGTLMFSRLQLLDAKTAKVIRDLR